MNTGDYTKPTITEEAFRKAKSFDDIVGYVMENYKGKQLISCSPQILKRYNIQAGDREAIILGLLERYYAEVNKDFMPGGYQTGIVSILIP